MKNHLFLILFTSALAGGCSKEAPPAQAPEKPATNKPAASGNPITAPVDYLGAVAKAKQVAEKTIDSAGMNQHIQFFFAQEGRYPKDLNELVTMKYIPALPPPPYGMKFQYDATQGTLKIVPQ